MREERGQLAGPMVVYEAVTVWGSVGGDVSVIDNGKFYLRGAVYGKSDATGSSPAEDPVHPTQLLATVYHAMGIDPHAMVKNHLGQPRELVQAEPVMKLFG